MTYRACPFEDAAAEAARTGNWSPELQAHRDGCMVCTEATLVAAALAADAEELTADPRPLPDPQLIWLRATLDARRQQLDRATRGILWVQRATWMAAAAIALTFGPRLWRLIEGLFDSIRTLGSVADLPRAAGSPFLVLALSLTILGGLALYELTAVRE
jgi:hypothetical protein